ncbi:23S rRNA (guanosine(2251)-2'-O)-methyltransferase RlmB [Luteithermobacter gelatinilyticus]|uniref:23S rRNA (guanosine(2251)-2'-O)-methyltransferase RlmB n=1 Tax=Luteithermobacter gelatinilyticus TaxID=2582913 RepID=UPI001105B6B7|nr:23S rRNA (guanosine(2251)-2'-O)-methyltransferase RlmB [Luteithermobacter gelatinilyticus]
MKRKNKATPSAKKAPHATGRKGSATPGPRTAKRNSAQAGTALHPGQNTVPDRAGGLWLYGRHATFAALNNPERQKKRLLISRTQSTLYMDQLAELPNLPENLSLEIVDPDELGRVVPPDSPHQGIALNCAPLPRRHLEDSCAPLAAEQNLVLVLDQVTDPHNVGAIIRSAAAFGARALITPDRHAPPESGALAKAASGGLELVPWVRVTNLARALEQLADMGYWRLGLDGSAKLLAEAADFGTTIALVLGAEGRGLRKGTRDHCDALIKLPINPRVDSLNVSNAAAIALYEFSRRSR